MHLNNFNPREVVAQLEARGGVLIPRYLGERFRASMVPRLLALPYERAPEIHGDAEVHQDYFSAKSPEKVDFLSSLREKVLEHLDGQFRLLPEYPFATELAFREVSVQKYTPCSRGIGPHRDENKHNNLIAILVFLGTADLVLWRTRSIRDHVITLHEGDLFLLRANGFLNQDGKQRRIHSIENIRSLRISMGLRDLPDGEW